MELGDSVKRRRMKRRVKEQQWQSVEAEKRFEQLAFPLYDIHHNRTA
jgi:hypothetical protein